MRAIISFQRSGVPRNLGEVGQTTMYSVYILQSEKDGSRYIGVTGDLKRRLSEHNNGSAKYSSTRIPYTIKWFCGFASKEKAYEFEKYLKSSSGYAFTNKHLN